MLTVLCPEVPLDRPNDPRWPVGLADRLSRARMVARFHDKAPVPEATPYEHWLSARFELPFPAAAAAWQRYAWPVAPQGPPSPRLLTVIPASLHAGLDHLILMRPESLEIDMAQADALIDSANEHLAIDNVRLTATAPTCWLMEVPMPLQFTWHSSVTAEGRSIDAYMPAGPDARTLRRLLNELQMRWHEHPVNERRAEAGLPAINTVWVDGWLEPRSARPFAAVHSDHPVTRGVAIGHGLPDDCVTGAAGNPLVGRSERDDADHLLELRGEDALSRLAECLSNSESPVEVVLTDDRQWLALRCAPGDRWRFWQRSRLGLSDEERHA